MTPLTQEKIKELRAQAFRDNYNDPIRWADVHRLLDVAEAYARMHSGTEERKAAQKESHND